jgi:hypothetical protein
MTSIFVPYDKNVSADKKQGWHCQALAWQCIPKSHGQTAFDRATLISSQKLGCE